jgi:hypothetical protein
MGIIFCFEDQITSNARTEAKKAGPLIIDGQTEKDSSHRVIDKIQIFTFEEFFESNARPRYPGIILEKKKPPKRLMGHKQHEQIEMEI